MDSFIPEELYSQILEHLPIICVDLIPVFDKKFLLTKRIKEPGKGSWFPAGGRVYKGETLIEAAIRKAREELGILADRTDLCRFAVEETIFTGATIDQNRHSVNILFTLNLTGTAAPEIRADEEQISEVKWFQKVDPLWHMYVQNVLFKAGFNHKNNPWI